MFVKQLKKAGFHVLFLLISAHSFAESDTRYEFESRSGIKSDLIYLMGYQLVATGITYYSPESFSNWSEEEKDALGFSQWKENIQNPVWDKDHWAVNYVLHPYWGAAYYIRARERGFSRKGSFWISALFSTVYEFGFESFLEEPSIQDLIITPAGGALLGLYFEDVRDRTRSKIGPLSRIDKMKLGLTDPLGALNRRIGSWLGINSDKLTPQFGFRLLRHGHARKKQTSQIPDSRKKIDGLAITFNYRW